MSLPLCWVTLQAARLDKPCPTTIYNPRLVCHQPSLKRLPLQWTQCPASDTLCPSTYSPPVRAEWRHPFSYSLPVLCFNENSLVLGLFACHSPCVSLPPCQTHCRTLVRKAFKIRQVSVPKQLVRSPVPKFLKVTLTSYFGRLPLGVFMGRWLVSAVWDRVIKFPPFLEGGFPHTPARLLVRTFTLLPNLSLNSLSLFSHCCQQWMERHTSLLNCCCCLLSLPTLKSLLPSLKWRHDDGAGLQKNTSSQSVVLTPSVKSCTKLAIFSSLLAAACSSKLQIINIIEKAPGVRMLTQTNLQNWMPPQYRSKNNDAFYQISIGFASPGIVNTHP